MQFWYLEEGRTGTILPPWGWKPQSRNDGAKWYTDFMMILWRHYTRLNFPPKTSSCIQEINSSMMKQCLIRVFCYMQANTLGTKEMMQEAIDSTLFILKFLINWYLNLRFVSEDWWDNRECIWTKEIHNRWISCFLPPICIECSGCPMSTGFQQSHNAWKCKETYKMQKVNVLQLRLYKQVERETLTAPKGHSLYLNQNLL